MNNRDLVKYIDKNFVWNIIGLTSNAIYPVIIIIIISRINGIALGGLFSFIFYLVSVLSTISMYGGRVFQVSDTKNLYSNNEYIGLKFYTSLVMIIVGLFFSILSNYNLERFILIILLMLFRMLESIGDSYYGIMHKKNDIYLIGKSYFLKAFISVFLFLLIDIFTQNILFSSFSFAISQILVFVFYDKKNIGNTNILSVSLNKRIIKLAKLLFPLFIFAFMQLFILNIVRYFVDIKLSNETQGYFGVILSLSSLMSLTGSFAINFMMMKLSHLYDKRKITKLNSLVVRMVVSIILIGLAIVLIGYLIIPELLFMVYGISFQNFRIEIVLSLISGIMFSIYAILSNVLSVIREFKVQLYSYLVTMVLSIIICLVLIEKYSVSGAVYSYLFTMAILIINFLITYIYTIKKVQK